MAKAGKRRFVEVDRRRPQSGRDEVRKETVCRRIRGKKGKETTEVIIKVHR